MTNGLCISAGGLQVAEPHDPMHIDSAEFWINFNSIEMKWFQFEMLNSFLGLEVAEPDGRMQMKWVTMKWVASLTTLFTSRRSVSISIWNFAVSGYFPKRRRRRLNGRGGIDPPSPLSSPFSSFSSFSCLEHFILLLFLPPTTPTTPTSVYLISPYFSRRWAHAPVCTSSA